MRQFGTLIGALLLALPAFGAELGDDGLHKAAWMRDTFKDMGEDLAEASAEGKRLLVIWEQRGCIYCTKMHEEIYPVDRIDALLHEHFFVVQMNLFGDVEVTDFDGDVRSEKDMAMKWGIMFTPTLMFFPETVDDGMHGGDAAVVQMPGAFGVGTTGDLLTWVVEKGYLGAENFQKYHARKISERRAASE
ncbi:thioredoxin family protein [Aliiroseovarius sp.]|uniref:thioredoxin family protein n=1 Tax=Aliiroseovarius sp. TaxID=1872442 RepID=UPI003BADABA9